MVNSTGPLGVIGRSLVLFSSSEISGAKFFDDVFTGKYAFIGEKNCEFIAR